MVVLVFVVISLRPPEMLFAVFVAYALSAYVMWVWGYFKRKPAADTHPEQDRTEPVVK